MMLDTHPFIALVRRELLRTLRTARPFLLLVAVVALTSLAILSTWPDTDTQFLSASHASRTIAYFTLIAWSLIALFVVPAYAATSIISERERDSYDLIHTSLITPWGFVLGKLLNCVGIFAIFAAASAPLAATVLFLLGLDWFRFLFAAGLMFLTAVSYASLGLLASAWARSSMRALLRGYMFVALATGLPLALILVLLDGMRFRDLAHLGGEVVAVMFTPFQAIGMLEGARGFSPAAINASIHLLIITFSYLLTVLAVQTFPQRQLQTLRRRENWRFWKTSDSLPASLPKIQPPVPDNANPVYVREYRCNGISQAAPRLVVISSVTTLLVCFLTFFSVDPTHMTMTDITIPATLFEFVLVGIITPVIAANSISREGELGNLDMLRLSLLTPRDIIAGKSRAAWRALMPMLVVFLLFGALVYFVYPNRAERTRGVTSILTGYGSVTVATMLAVNLSMLASAYTKRSLTSLLLALALIAWFFCIFHGAICLGSSCVYHLLVGDLSFDSLDDWRHLGSLEKVLYLLSPTTGYLRNTERTSSHETLINVYWLCNMAISVFTAGLVRWLAIRGLARRWKASNARKGE